jgi:hypothetical protein
MGKDERDAEARLHRAQELRGEIRRLGAFKDPNHPKSPREITDEAARQARERTIKQKDKKENNKAP